MTRAGGVPSASVGMLEADDGQAKNMDPDIWRAVACCSLTDEEERLVVSHSQCILVLLCLFGECLQSFRLTKRPPERDNPRRMFHVLTLPGLPSYIAFHFANAHRYLRNRLSTISLISWPVPPLLMCPVNRLTVSGRSPIFVSLSSSTCFVGTTFRLL